MTKRPPTLSRAIARGLSPFGGERAAELVPHARFAGPMPWVIAIMVALTAIASAAGLSLSNVADQARADLSGGATVQIIEPRVAERERQAALVEDTLASDPAVASLKRVSESELDELLEPWLGDGAGGDSVPVPALIDVRLRNDANQEEIARLSVLLADVAPAARIDAQASWLAPVFSALSALRWLSVALVLVLAVTSAAAVWLAARSAFGANRETIEVVHHLGGTEKQIARIFQRAIAFDATLGGLVGLILGLVTIILLGRQFEQLGSGMISTAGLGWLDWLIIAAIPLAGIAIASFTARVTVLAALRRML